MAIPSSDSPATVTARDHNGPPFFAVSVRKLVILSICTLGLYELFWFYQNWRLVREREASNIQPFWRAFFSFFFCYAMFKRMRDFPVQSVDTASLPAGPLTAGWIITTCLWRLPDPYWLLCFLAFLFLIPVQRVVTRINEAVAPGHDRNDRFSTANWVTIVVGGLVFLLGVIGTFLPDPSV